MTKDWRRTERRCETRWSELIFNGRASSDEEKMSEGRKQKLASWTRKVVTEPWNYSIKTTVFLQCKTLTENSFSSIARRLRLRKNNFRFLATFSVCVLLTTKLILLCVHEHQNIWQFCSFWYLRIAFHDTKFPSHFIRVYFTHKKEIILCFSLFACFGQLKLHSISFFHF